VNHHPTSTKVIQFIVSKASDDSFKMAIQKHIIQQISQQQQQQQSSGANWSLVNIMNMIESLKLPSTDVDQVCKKIVCEIGREPEQMPRDCVQEIEKCDIIKICDFFANLQNNVEERLFIEVARLGLQVVCRKLMTDQTVSPLLLAILAIIRHDAIDQGVVFILEASKHDSDDAKIRAVKKLILCLRQIVYLPIQLHVWILKILTSLNELKQHGMLDEITAEHLMPLFLTLILPDRRDKVFPIVHFMLVTLNSNEIFYKLSQRIMNVLHKLKDDCSEIFESLMDTIAEIIDHFPATNDAVKIKKYLEMHNRITTTHSRSNKYFKMSPVSHNYKTNVRVGLQNLGNTCYMNSILQALCMTKQFSRAVLTMNTNIPVMSKLQQLLGFMLFSERSDLDPSFVLSYIRPAEFLPGIQQDSSEFMGSLLDKLHEAETKKIKSEEGWDDAGGATNNDMNSNECDKTEGDGGATKNKILDNTPPLAQQTLVQKIFFGKMSTRCTCLTCHSNSIIVDVLRDLQLSFPEEMKNNEIGPTLEPKYSVQELLDYYFTTEQLNLDADNQYHCDQCTSLSDGVRCTEIIQAPKNLVLTLKHFRYSRHHTRSKLLYNVEHNEEIFLRVRPSLESNAYRTVKYKIYAAVVHSGSSMDCGHYYTYARDNSLDVWYRFNDNVVSISKLEELQK